MAKRYDQVAFDLLNLMAREGVAGAAGLGHFANDALTSVLTGGNYGNVPQNFQQAVDQYLTPKREFMAQNFNYTPGQDARATEQRMAENMLGLFSRAPESVKRTAASAAQIAEQNPEALAALDMLSLMPGPGQTATAGAGLLKLAARAPSLDKTMRVGERFEMPLPDAGQASAPGSMSRAGFIYGDQAPDADLTVKEVGYDLQRQADEIFTNPISYTPENAQLISNSLMPEVLAAYRAKPEVAEWYRDNLLESIEIASRIHPEILKSDFNKDMFLLGQAITSVDTAVDLNAQYANTVFDYFKANGRFPEFGKGKGSDAMKKNFRLANDTIESYGPDKFSKLLHTEYAVRDLRKLGFSVDSELVDTVLPGSVIFGPKVGGGFFQNLSGNFDPVTFDVWWMRNFGRHTGEVLPSAERRMNAAQRFIANLDKETLERFNLQRSDIEMTENFVDSLNGAKLPAANVIHHSINRWAKDAKPEFVPERDEALFGLAADLHREYARGGFKDKSQINKSAKALDELLKPIAAPGTGSQRNFMREVVNNVRNDVKDKHGIDLNNAAIQALLWYAEKDLYAKMGVRKATGASDYAAAWRDIYGKR